MNNAVIVDVVRLASGKGKAGGALWGCHPVDLLGRVLSEVVARNDLDPARIDDVIAGCVEQVGDQIELVVADDGVGIKDEGAAKVPEKRGADYVAIFVRQLGGTIVPAQSKETGTVVRIRLPLLLVPPGGAERVAA